MKIIFLQLIIVLSFNIIAQTQDLTEQGYYYDTATDELILVSDTGHQLKIYLSSSESIDGDIVAIIDNNVVIIDKETEEIISSEKVHIFNSQITGYLSIDLKNTLNQTYYQINLDNQSFKNYKEQHLFNIGGIEVISKGLELLEHQKFN